MTTEKSPKIPSFNCEKCKYITSNKKDYSKHLLTLKHTKTTNDNGSTTDKSPIYIFMCDTCEKTYNDRAGLWRHKKKCTIGNDLEKEDKIIRNIAKNIIVDK